MRRRVLQHGRLTWLSYMLGYLTGLKMGMYVDAMRYLTYAGFPGSRGHEALDAATWEYGSIV